MSEWATQTFNSSTSWMAPAGCFFVMLYGIGGGGGGGGGGRPPAASSTAARGGGGGGGGGAVAGFIMVPVVPGTSYVITIGAGGTNGTGGATDNSAGISGGNGADTSFGSLATFPGAGGGAGGGGNPTGIGTGVGGPCIRTIVDYYIVSPNLPGAVLFQAPGQGATGGNNWLTTSGYLAVAAQPAIGNASQAAQPSPQFGSDATGVGGYAAGGGGSSVYAAGGASGLGGAGAFLSAGSVGGTGGSVSANTGAGGGGGGGGGNAASGVGGSGNGGPGGTGGSGKLTVFFLQ